MCAADNDRRQAVGRDNLMRLPEVKERTKLSRTTIYRRINKGMFPRPTPISDGLVAWYESEIDRWVENPMGYRSPQQLERTVCNE